MNAFFKQSCISDCQKKHSLSQKYTYYISITQFVTKHNFFVNWKCSLDINRSVHCHHLPTLCAEAPVISKKHNHNIINRLHGAYRSHNPYLLSKDIQYRYAHHEISHHQYDHKERV